MDHETAGTLAEQILDEIGEAVIADREFLETTLTGILARGHVLLEDVPGTGKTLTARTFANAMGLSFQRIQFTPDLLPSDITGSNIFSEADGEFDFQRGPIFANVVLADEINRAPPKTQAALLEAMGEKQVTVDGETYDLPDPFFVIATQNPIEQEGTFGLPEAQRDRFMIKTSLGYPGAAGERTLLDRRASRTERVPSVEAVVDAADVRTLQSMPEQVDVDPRLRDYVVELGRWTRRDQRVDVGVSPRGVQRLFEAARARAALAGRGYVVPDDIKGVVEAVFAHRLVLTADAELQGVTRTDVIHDALAAVAVPGVEGDGAAPAAANGGTRQPEDHPTHANGGQQTGHSPQQGDKRHGDGQQNPQQGDQHHGDGQQNPQQGDRRGGDGRQPRGQRGNSQPGGGGRDDSPQE
jgi:MoxR-like ATPase